MLETFRDSVCVSPSSVLAVNDQVVRVHSHFSSSAVLYSFRITDDQLVRCSDVVDEDVDLDVNSSQEMFT